MKRWTADEVYVPGAFVTGPLVGWLGCRYTFILATSLIAAGWETFWGDQKQGIFTESILSCFWAAETEHESSTWDHLSLQFVWRFFGANNLNGQTRQARIPPLPSQNLKELVALQSWKFSSRILNEIKSNSAFPRGLQPYCTKILTGLMCGIWFLLNKKRLCSALCCLATWLQMTACKLRFGGVPWWTSPWIHKRNGMKWVIFLLKKQRPCWGIAPIAYWSFTFISLVGSWNKIFSGTPKKGWGGGGCWMLMLSMGRLQSRVKRHQQTLIFDSGGPREPQI